MTSSNALLTVIVPPTLVLQLWADYPLLDLSGMLSSNFVLQYCTNLAGSNWMNLLSLSMRSVQRAGLVVQRGAPEQVFVLGVGIGNLGRKQVKLRLVELHDRTDAVAIARLGEFKGLFGIVQEL